MTSATGSNGDSPLVVVIDDEEDITTFLGLALEDAGYRAEPVNDAVAAMGVLRREAPALICLDLLMPGRTGASLYQEIRHDPPLARTPVLILSGLGAAGQIDELLRRKESLAAPTGYLEKPIEPEPFLDAVALLIGQGQTEPEPPESRP